MGYAYSAHIGYLFTEHPLTERVAAAAGAGFAAIEHPAPYAVPATEMAAVLNAAGVRYTQFALPSGDASKGEKGFAIFPGRRGEFRAGVLPALDYAQTVGATMVHAMAGVIAPDQRRRDHWDCYVENLAFAAGAAAERGITIIVEPMSQGAVPDYYIATPELGARAIAETGAANLGLLLDVFHTTSAGLEPEHENETHAGLLAHVHLADHPGRHEPGSGTVDFAAVEQALRRVGYTGVLGCEYGPATSTAAGLGWMHGHVAAARPG